MRELKGEEIEDEVRASVNLGIDLRIDEDYVPDMSQRLVVYRRGGGARGRAAEIERGRWRKVVADRYGPLPDSVLNLADYGASASWPTGSASSPSTAQGSRRRVEIPKGEPASRAPDRGGSSGWCAAART